MNLESLRYLYLRRVVGTLVSLLGVDLADRLARRLARRVYDLNTPARRLAEARLALAASAAQSTLGDPQRVVASMYEHTGRFWVEALFARRLLEDDSWRRYVTVENEQGLSVLARSPRGCLFATAYLGNPAIAALILAKYLRPLNVLVDTFSQPQLRVWQADLYADPHVRAIDRRDASRRLPEVLANGGPVMVLADHERRRGRAVPTTFLGRAFNCYPTLGRLASWLNVPIAVVSCHRDAEAFRFNMAIHEVISPAAGADPDDLVRRTMAVLERVILSCPEQYLWSLPTSAALVVEPGVTRTARAVDLLRSGGSESPQPGGFRTERAASSSLGTKIRKMPVESLALPDGVETLCADEGLPPRQGVASDQSR